MSRIRLIVACLGVAAVVAVTCVVAVAAPATFRSSAAATEYCSSPVLAARQHVVAVLTKQVAVAHAAHRDKAAAALAAALAKARARVAACG